MKSRLRYSLLALGIFTVTALPAHAVSSFFETFSAASLNATRWSLTREGGLLAPSAGKLLYNVKTASGPNSSHIILRDIQPKFNESWEVVVDAVNTNRADSWTWIGVAVLNAADPDDFVGLEITGGDNRTEILSDFGTNGEEAADVVKRISSTNASLRVTFSSVTKVITLWYRTSASAAWRNHATFSTTNSSIAKRRGDWRMKATGKFKLALYGGGEDGAIIRGGQMSLDDFVIRNLR